MIITVFGASKPDKETYDLSYELGKLIALNGYTLKNGGTTGTMESSAKGCVENNGTVIGAILNDSKNKNLEQANKYCTKVIKLETYPSRVTELLNCDRIIVLPGQIGTLNELFVAWIKEIINYNGKPIIIMGKRNKKLLDFLLENKFIKEDEHLPFIKYVETLDEIDFLN